MESVEAMRAFNNNTLETMVFIALVVQQVNHISANNASECAVNNKQKPITIQWTTQKKKKIAASWAFLFVYLTFIEAN